MSGQVRFRFVSLYEDLELISAEAIPYSADRRSPAVYMPRKELG